MPGVFIYVITTPRTKEEPKIFILFKIFGLKDFLKQSNYIGEKSIKYYKCIQYKYILDINLDCWINTGKEQF